MGPEHLHFLPAPVLYGSLVPSLSREHSAYLSRPVIEMKMKDSSRCCLSSPLCTGRAGPDGLRLRCPVPPPAPPLPKPCPFFYVSPQTLPRMAQLSAPHVPTRGLPGPPWYGCISAAASPPVQPSPCSIPGCLAHRRPLALFVSKVMFSANSMALEGRDMVTMSISLS